MGCFDLSSLRHPRRTRFFLLPGRGGDASLSLSFSRGIDSKISAACADREIVSNVVQKPKAIRKDRGLAAFCGDLFLYGAVLADDLRSDDRLFRHPRRPASDLDADAG